MRQAGQSRREGERGKAILRSLYEIELGLTGRRLRKHDKAIWASQTDLPPSLSPFLCRLPLAPLAGAALAPLKIIISTTHQVAINSRRGRLCEAPSLVKIEIRKR